MIFYKSPIKERLGDYLNRISIEYLLLSLNEKVKISEELVKRLRENPSGIEIYNPIKKIRKEKDDDI